MKEKRETTAQNPTETDGLVELKAIAPFHEDLRKTAGAVRYWAKERLLNELTRGDDADIATIREHLDILHQLKGLD